MFSFVILTFLSNMIKIKTWPNVGNYRKKFHLCLSVKYYTRTTDNNKSDMNPSFYRSCIPCYSAYLRSLYLFYCDSNHKGRYECCFSSLALSGIHRTHRSGAECCGHGSRGPGHSQLPVGSRPDKTWRHVALSHTLGSSPPSIPRTKWVNLNSQNSL